ncbi:MAG: DEAD/DEAH box helicase family protein [Polyangiales bacterium]
MKRRPYQDEAVKAVLEGWKNGDRSVLLVMATGCGKTFVATEILRDLLQKAPANDNGETP